MPRGTVNLCVARWSMAARAACNSHGNGGGRQPPPPDTVAKGAKGARGRQAAGGWVQCPLCPPKSMRRYRLGTGFSAHLDDRHQDGALRDSGVDLRAAATAAWHQEVAAVAAAAGVFAQRAAGGPSGKAYKAGGKAMVTPWRHTPPHVSTPAELGLPLAR